MNIRETAQITWSQVFGRAGQVAAEAMVRLKTPVLAVLLAGCIVSALLAAWSYQSKQYDNRIIAALSSGKDIAVDRNADHVRVIAARANFLLYRDRLDEAQSLVDEARKRDSASPHWWAWFGTASESGPTGAVLSDVVCDLLYNMANARLRRAETLIGKRDLDTAVAQVRLAKGEYREVLASRPGDWDARYNLEYAMRLVRDFPSRERDGKDQPENAKKLWTDLPGIPKGLP